MPLRSEGLGEDPRPRFKRSGGLPHDPAGNLARLAVTRPMAATPASPLVVVRSKRMMPIHDDESAGRVGPLASTLNVPSAAASAPPGCYLPGASGSACPR